MVATAATADAVGELSSIIINHNEIFSYLPGPNISSSGKVTGHTQYTCCIFPHTSHSNTYTTCKFIFFPMVLVVARLS